MSTPTHIEGGGGQSEEEQPNFAKSRFVNLIRQYSLQVSNTMCGLKLKDRCKITQVHAFNPPDASTSTTITTTTGKPHHNHQGYPTISSVDSISATTAETLISFGLSTTDSLEPPIDYFLKSIDFIESLAELYRRIEKNSYFDKYLVYLK